MKRIARRVGSRVFAAASAVQLLVFVLIYIHIACFQFFEQKGRGSLLQFFDFATHNHGMLLLQAFLLACAAFLVVASITGRWGGTAIVLSRKPFGWVGPFTYLPSAFVAGLVFAGAIILLDPSRLAGFEAESIREREFWTPALVFGLLVWIPSIVTGIIAGLIAVTLGQRALDEAETSQTSAK